MKNKYNFILLAIIGIVLMNIEFTMYTLMSIFAVISVVIITPLFLVTTIAMRYIDERGVWKIYALTAFLMYIYGIYANTYQVFIVLAGVIFVWFYRTYLFDLRSTDLLVGIFVSYFLLFCALTLYFVFAYNLNINLGMVFLVNTLIGATINTIIMFIVLSIFVEKIEEDDQ